mmetsp:Transcript_4558/g.6872  ORF Transcript_4558/g.6872 Transcript_4558/m.6872 type:complete len:403 (+) Transcript_4558:46-1254(+)
MEEQTEEDVWTELTGEEEWRVECIKHVRIAPLARASTQKYGRLDLIRLNIQKSSRPPYRERFCWNDADDRWQASLYLYVFPHLPPGLEQCLRRYVLERAENPIRSRLRWDGQQKPQRRDATEWKALRSGRNDFWAFPERTANAQELAVDWTSGPDRYRIIRHPESRPEAGWLRCFRFFAYPATKYHILYRDWPSGAPVSTSYRIISGHLCPVQRPWRCAFAFFALDEQAPGTNKYFIQKTPQSEYYPRIRIGMTPAQCGGWDPHDQFIFYAPDMPWPCTAKFNVQYKMRGGPDAELEQNRLAIADILAPHACGSLWTDKFAIFLYPAPTIDLEPDDWDLQPQQSNYHGQNEKKEYYDEQQEQYDRPQEHQYSSSQYYYYDATIDDEQGNDHIGYENSNYYYY